MISLVCQSLRENNHWQHAYKCRKLRHVSGGGESSENFFRIGVCWLTNLTVITCSNIICDCCSNSPFILKYLQEKVIRKQDLARSPYCHANRLCSPVVSSRKCGNIIFPARQQSNWLCSAFFSFSTCFVLIFRLLDLQFLSLLIARRKKQAASFHNC